MAAQTECQRLLLGGVGCGDGSSLWPHLLRYYQLEQLVGDVVSAFEHNQKVLNSISYALKFSNVLNGLQFLSYEDFIK